MKFFVKAHPNAHKNQIIQLSNSEFEVYTTATPENNKANEAIIQLLAKHFRIGKTKITLITGEKSKNKVFEIETI